MTPIEEHTQRGTPFGLYLRTPLYTPSYGGSPLYTLPYPPSPWGVLGVKRGFNSLNEICMGILKKLFIKFLGKFGIHIGINNYKLIIMKNLLVILTLGLFSCSTSTDMVCCESKTDCTKEVVCCEMDHCNTDKCEGNCCDMSCCG